MKSIMFWWKHLIKTRVFLLQVFLKELERQQLQDMRHREVMRKIIFLQRWFRAHLQRNEFVDMRRAAILIQVNRTLCSGFSALASMHLLLLSRWITRLRFCLLGFMAQVLQKGAKATGSYCDPSCVARTQTEIRVPPTKTRSNKNTSSSQRTLGAQEVKTQQVPS